MGTVGIVQSMIDHMWAVFKTLVGWWLVGDYITLYLLGIVIQELGIPFKNHAVFPGSMTEGWLFHTAHVSHYKYSYPISLYYHLVMTNIAMEQSQP